MHGCDISLLIKPRARSLRLFVSALCDSLLSQPFCDILIVSAFCVSLFVSAFCVSLLPQPCVSAFCDSFFMAAFCDSLVYQPFVTAFLWQPVVTACCGSLFLSAFCDWEDGDAAMGCAVLLKVSSNTRMRRLCDQLYLIPYGNTWLKREMLQQLKVSLKQTSLYKTSKVSFAMLLVSNNYCSYALC